MVLVALLISVAAMGGGLSWPAIFGVVVIVISAIFIRLAIKESKMPRLFQTDRRRQLEPIETSQEVRNKVLRQNFKPSLIPSDLDAVVVGSGMGGLTTAALMSLAGKRVLVLEQHDRAGGCTHSFVEKGYEFDVGIHYVGEMGVSRKKRSGGAVSGGSRRLLDQITGGQLQWAPLEDTFDVVTIGNRRFPLPQGLENIAEFLAGEFPADKAGIEEFFRLCWQVDKSMDNFGLAKMLPATLVKFLLRFRLLPGSATLLKFFSTSAQEVVDSLVKSPDLKAILLYCFGDYGVPPSRAPFAMQATLLTHFSNGAFYPVGGASEIAYHLIPTIESAGGRVFVKANVEQILTSDDGRVIGVKVRNKGVDVEIRSPLVISNAGMRNTFDSLLPASFLAKSSVGHFLPSLRPGLACFQLFVGLRGSSEDLALKKQNFWCFSRPDLDGAVEDYMRLSSEEAMEAEIPLMFVSFPSAKDPTWTSRFPPADEDAQKTTCAIVTLVNWDWFRGHDKGDESVVRKRGDDDYERLKAAITQRLWEAVAKLFPQLADKVDYMEGGTPLTHNYYIKSTAGEIYGLDHGLDRFALEPLVHLRPDVGIPGLLMTGQDVFTCGFIGAFYGGVAAAGSALGLGIRIFLQMDGIGKGWKEKKAD